MKSILQSCSIIAILRNVAPDILLPYVRCILEAGITNFEIAMNSPDGANQIRLVKKEFGDAVTVGAGTATTIQRIEDAKNAGSEYFLTPSADATLLQYYQKNHLTLLPGVMTPSDVNLCLKYGYPIMKLFPAGELPMSYIKSLKGPFQDTDYVAVGGVNAENIENFFDSGFIGTGIGSNLVPQHFIEHKEWNLATEYLKQFYSKYV